MNELALFLRVSAKCSNIPRIHDYQKKKAASLVFIINLKGKPNIFQKEKERKSPKTSYKIF